ncbi:MAG: hypothetical protein IJ063_06570 [Ruminococcus sp.]|nr:hypothetical protein [Ruminococcus sp.]
MKLALCFGLTGAVLLPLLYEVFANISSTVGLVLVAGWVLFAAVKFSGLSFKEAIIGITCCIAYSGVLGFVCYLAIHPLVVNTLVKHSVYFQLSYRAQLVFVGLCFLIFMGMYLVWLVRFACRKTIEKFRSNSEKAGEYIDNAFDDTEDK